MACRTLLILLLLATVTSAQTRPAKLPDSAATLQEAYDLSQVGDPRALRPAMDMLTTASADENPWARPADVMTAAGIVGQFGYTPAAGLIEWYLADPSLPPVHAERLVMVLSQLRDRQSIPRLRAALKDERSHATRAYAARALIEMGEADAVEAMVSDYQFYLDSLVESTWPRVVVRSVLERMNDPKLIAAIERLKDRPGQVQKAQNNITTLLVAMNLNTKPPVELVRVAQDSDWRRASDRYNAVQALAEYGTPAEIPAMLQLAAWTNFTGPELQHGLFRQEVAKAIARIQQRHWQAILESGLPVVADAKSRLEALHGDTPSRR